MQRFYVEFQSFSVTVTPSMVISVTRLIPGSSSGLQSRCLRLPVKTISTDCSLHPPRRLCFTLRLSVCLSLCLFVCPLALATSRETYRSDLYENFTTDKEVDKEKLVKFWKSSASGSRPRIIKGFFNITIAFFHHLVHNYGKTDRIFMKILSLNKLVPIKGG